MVGISELQAAIFLILPRRGNQVGGGCARAGPNLIISGSSGQRRTASGLQTDDTAKPFVWTVKAADILEKAERARSALGNG